jgi:hypothetical protein
MSPMGSGEKHEGGHMTIRTQAGSRQWLIERMTKTVRTAKWQGIRLSITDEAHRLAEDPACRFSFEEIKDELLLLAVSQRLPMELDSIARPGVAHTF